jgi:hypothetical protein
MSIEAFCQRVCRGEKVQVLELLVARKVRE